MKIVAQVIENHIKDMNLTKEELRLFSRIQLLQKIDKELLKFDDFFHEEEYDKGDTVVYETQYIILSLETYTEIGQVLKQAGVNDYWRNAIYRLLIDKPKDKPKENEH